jgi:multidrug resistance efflux pump
MARQYRVEGTNDFLYVAIVLLALGVWSVKDGWFPSQRVLTKHPRTTEASFTVAGIVDEVRARPMDSVREGDLLATLVSTVARDRFEAAEAALAAAAAASGAEVPAAPTAANRAAAGEALRVARQALDACALKSPVSGDVIEVPAAPEREIRAGETAVVIRPNDSFYLFNKSLAFLSFAGAIACALIHRRVR